MAESNYERMLEVMNPDIYQRLRRAVELGKWPDGTALSAEQRETCMEAIIAFESANLPEEQRTGFIDRGSKAEAEVCDDPQPLILPES